VRNRYPSGQLVERSEVGRTGSRIRLVAVVTGALAVVVSACGGSGGSTASTASASTTTVAKAAVATTSTVPAPTKTLLQLAKGEGSLTTLVHLLEVAGLTSTLEGAGPFSLLAPTDAAFAKMDAATLDKLTKDPALLKKVLQFGVVGKKIGKTDITKGSVPTVEGSPLTLKATSGRYPTVNGFTITKGARATNGSIFVIDTVLVPPDVTLP
jgi:transforming growth factor-beta-induced protein